MTKFLISILFSLVASKNIILVGDSRFVGMATSLMGFSYSTIKNEGGTGTNVRSTSPRKYSGHSIQVTAQVSASSYTFSSGSEVYISLHTQLKTAEPGTIVLLWLGINDCGAVSSTYSFYATLALNYPKLNFIALSITGVNESKTWIKNSSVRNFNKELSERITYSGIYNIQFKSILNGDDPNSIMLDGRIFPISNFLTYDGLHYMREGYSYLWRAMANIL